MNRQATLTLLLSILSAVALTSCSTNPEALRSSQLNATRIGSVEIGQTASKVHEIMRHGPEIRSRSVTSDGTIEEWSFVTDYDRHVMTTVILENGIVTAIREGVWDGAWSRPKRFTPEELKAMERGE